MPITAALVASAGQTILGVGQSIRANRLRKKALREFQSNPYTTPLSATRAVNMAGQQAQGTRLPGQDVMEENLRSGTAQSLAQARRAATSPSQILASTIQSYNAQQQAQQNLDLQAAQNWQERQNIYRNAVMALSPYEEKSWQYNTLAPIQAKLNMAGQMSQSGTQNIGQGIQSGLGVLANKQMLDSLNPSGVSGAADHTQQYYLGQMKQQPFVNPTINAQRTTLMQPNQSFLGDQSLYANNIPR